MSPHPTIRLRTSLSYAQFLDSVTGLNRLHLSPDQVDLTENRRLPGSGRIALDFLTQPEVLPALSSCSTPKARPVHHTTRHPNMADEVAPSPIPTANGTFAMNDAAGETVAAIAEADKISAGECRQCTRLASLSFGR